jgi:hypothetical protein
MVAAHWNFIFLFDELEYALLIKLAQGKKLQIRCYQQYHSRWAKFNGYKETMNHTAEAKL